MVPDTVNFSLLHRTHIGAYRIALRFILSRISNGFFDKKNDGLIVFAPDFPDEVVQIN